MCSVSWPHTVPFPTALTSTRRTVCRSLTPATAAAPVYPPSPSPHTGQGQAMLKHSSTETLAPIPPALQPPSISITLQLALQALSNSTKRLHKCHNLNSCPRMSTFCVLSGTIIVSVMIALLEHCCSGVPLCRSLTVSLWENDTSSAHSTARETKTNRL